MKTIIVIPTYNERENVKILIPKISDVFKKNNIDGKIIVVDDNSPDGTAGVIKEFQNKYPVALIERPEKMGLGSAYVCGFRMGLDENTDMIFEMDGDMSHDPEHIPEFIDKINQGFDVVVGSRLVKGGKLIGWNWRRKLISWGGNFLGRRIAGIDVSDLTSGYRVYRAEVIKSIELDKVKSKGYDFQLEMLARVIRKGYRVGVIPIVFHGRSEGKSKLSKTDKINFFLTALKIRLGLI